MATTLDLKHLSNAVYGDPLQQNPAGNWSLLLASDPTDPTGYFGAAYFNTQTREIVFVHRGTDDQNDVHSDTQLAAGYVMDQYAKAEAFRLLVIASLGEPPSNISATGHSLGGAIAVASSGKWVQRRNIQCSRDGARNIGFQQQIR